MNLIRLLLPEKYYHEIKEVVKFSKKVNLNYDCLRAIAFELEDGSSFKECISDLNIINTEWPAYDVELELTNGQTVRKHGVNIDMFNGKDSNIIYMMDNKERDIIDVTYMAEDVMYDNKKGAYVIDKKKINICADNDFSYADDYESFKNAKPASDLIIRLAKPESIHYMI